MKNLLLFVLISIIIFPSCTKIEGLGGHASIQGKVYVLDYNEELTTKLDEYYGANIDVYIIYGNDVIYNDDFSTSYDGSYRFEHLQPGNYTIFAYSEDTTKVTEGNIFPVFKYITIGKDDDSITLDDIVIVK